MTVSERQKKGMAYIVNADMKQEMKRCRTLLQKLNTMDTNDEEGISAVIKQLFGKSSTLLVRPPFYCDCGTHIEVGKNFFANYNCTMLDVARIVIGDNCQIAPNVSIYAGGTHTPQNPQHRLRIWKGSYNRKQRLDWWECCGVSWSSYWKQRRHRGRKCCYAGHWRLGYCRG